LRSYFLVFFRAENTSAAADILQSMFVFPIEGSSLIGQKDWISLVMIAAIITLLSPNTQQIMGQYDPAFLDSH